MKRFWVALWLIILLVHLVTLVFGYLRERKSPTGLLPMRAELVELAELTNDEWNRLGFAGSPVEREAQPTNPEDELLQCQALILRLRDVEQVLSSAGTEIRIAEDLQAWLGRHFEQTEGLRASPYLAGLLRWMSPFLSSDRLCALQRLLLQPDQGSAFPAISFELMGEPMAMGQSLLSAENGAAMWRLQELDLCPAPSASNWWIRGSCSYDIETIP